MFVGRADRGPLPGRPDAARAVPGRRRGGRAARRDGPDVAPGGVHRARRAGPPAARDAGGAAAVGRTGSCAPGDDGDVAGEVRQRLLDRFGLFGIRLSTTLARQGADTPAALAAELVARSGLRDLEQVLHTQFTERRDVLKARSALLAVDAVLPPAGDGAGPARDGGADPGDREGACGRPRVHRAPAARRAAVRGGAPAPGRRRGGRTAARRHRHRPRGPAGPARGRGPRGAAARRRSPRWSAGSGTRSTRCWRGRRRRRAARSSAAARASWRASRCGVVAGKPRSGRRRNVAFASPDPARAVSRGAAASVYSDILDGPRPRHPGSHANARGGHGRTAQRTTGPGGRP